MSNTSKPIIWMVHPRNLQDIEKGMPLLAKSPSFLKLIMLLCLSPYKVSAFNENGHIRGYVVAVPLLPLHFQKYKTFSRFRLTQAFRLAKKLGAEKVSVGGMITTLAEKADLGNKFGIEVFDGTHLLAQIAADKISHLLREQGTSIRSIGIIGATTKTGSQLSKYLAEENIQELHLFAKTAANVQKLADECRRKETGKKRIIVHTDLSSVGACDVCILTAFIPEAGKDIISNLKPKSFFFSIIEPVSPFVFDIEKQRSDIKLTKGITIKAPSLSYAGLDFVIPSGNAFSCLAEALVADTGNTPDKPSEIEKSMKEHNFQVV